MTNDTKNFTSFARLEDFVHRGLKPSVPWRCVEPQNTANAETYLLDHFKKLISGVWVLTFG